MSRTQDIGRRIELVPMDPHFHGIAIALYRQVRDQMPMYRVHTYSSKAGAAERIAFVMQAMQVLGGLDRTDDDLLYFSCKAAHALAVRRVFLEACKLDRGPVTVRPLTIADRKSGLTILATAQGQGVYRVTAEGEGKDAERRIAVVVNGLMKLGEMAAVDGVADQVAFDCGTAHDAVVGLLLVRAPNVRAVVREQEATASRGVLSAPSQQR